MLNFCFVHFSQIRRIRWELQWQYLCWFNALTHNNASDYQTNRLTDYQVKGRMD